jgi:hypothetical protein
MDFPACAVSAFMTAPETLSSITRSRVNSVACRVPSHGYPTDTGWAVTSQFLLRGIVCAQPQFSGDTGGRWRMGREASDSPEGAHNPKVAFTRLDPNQT